MNPLKVRFAATAVLIWLGQWTVSGCAGNVESGIGVGSFSPGGPPAGPPLSGGVGTSPDLGATEGVATDPDGNVYVSSQTLLSAYDSNWRLKWTNTNPIAGMPATVNHLGDIEYSGGYIYAPAESWNGCGNFAPTLLAVYSASTGRLITWSDITADGHEASAVAAVPGSDQVVVTSYCPGQGGYTTLWSYDLNALITNPPGSLLTYDNTITMSTPIPLMQGISWNANDNEFAVTADTSGPAGSIWLISAEGLVTGPVYVVPTSASLELEGVDFVSGDLYYLESQTVYGIGAVPAAPEFNTAPGTYCSAQMVSISGAQTGTVIFYTNDGSMPTTASTLYSGPIDVSSSMTLKAIAAVNGSANSAQTVGAYTMGGSNCTATSQAH
jgi:Chitobiase/beta-hexosaminidase C-terminal domain